MTDQKHFRNSRNGTKSSQNVREKAMAFQMFQNLLGIDSRRSQQVSSPHDQFDGNRDFVEAFGYYDDPDFDDFKHFYEHDGLAATIVDKPAQDMWQEKPEIFEVDENGQKVDDSDFSEAVKELDRSVKFISELRDVDRLARLGNFGILAIGFEDAASDQQQRREVSPESINGPDSVVWLQSHHQGNIDILKWNRDTTSSFLGMPELYEIDQSIPLVDEDRVDDEVSERPDIKTKGVDTVDTIRFHRDRVLHVAEDAKENPAIGRPALKRVINRLLDKIKVLGSTGEGFYQFASPRWHMQYPENFEIPSTDSTEFSDIQDQVEEFVLGFKDFLVTRGGEVEPLGGEDISPKEPYEVILDEVSIATGIPKTELRSHETGERASTENNRSYMNLLANRARNHAEPNILRPFIDKMQKFGVLPATPNGYEIDWPPVRKQTELEKSEIRANNAQAVKRVSPQGQTDLLFEEDELREIVGFSPRNEGQLTNSDRLELFREDKLREASMPDLFSQKDDTGGNDESIS